MSKKSNNQGRAYEYICLHSLQDAISAIRKSQIIHNSCYEAAQHAWNTLGIAEKALYTLSAKSTIDTIFALEPNIVEVDDDMLNLYIQSDENGEEADVRDIIIERKDIIWEIGLSIKHKHMAVKHSRLSEVLDFGQKWYGVKCSEEYWNAVKPIFDFLESEKANGTYFRDLKSKIDNVYVPVLKAFMQEVKKQVENNADVPRNLVEYILSKYDFYKVISVDNKRITTIQSFNMYGTLNQPSKTQKPSFKVPVMELPTTLLHMDFKPKSKTTVIMSFDNGWQFSFRIHNAKDLVEPSLKFDVRIEGMPPAVNISFNCKW
ncbi:MAG: HaeIII family restriction endonuclease [Prevotella sp.]|nr:HaeIII family restriction endonuclease [Clostridia bacterium]MDY5491668.1 HaeIII family restriction endonuclease [Prevotella sp.]